MTGRGPGKRSTRIVTEAPPEDDSGSLRVIRLEGEIDLGNAAEIGDRILGALHAQPAPDAALIDCDAVTLLAASAMTMMLRVQGCADTCSVALGWSRLHGLPLRAMQIVGLDAQLALLQ